MFGSVGEVYTKIDLHGWTIFSWTDCRRFTLQERLLALC